MRFSPSFCCAIGVAVLCASGFPDERRALAQEKPALAGVWVRNGEQSDAPTTPGDRGGERGRRGGMGPMGRGGGFGRGGAGRGGGRMGGDPEEMARVREAMRDILQPPDRLIITETDSMIAIAGPDGRTTRLAPDGRKIKDENTKVERRTRWEDDKLISEISGAGPGKITQTFSIEPGRRRLRIVVQTEGGPGGRSRTINHVYDPEER